MASNRVVYRCGACGTEEPKWAGRCSGCGAWNSFTEIVSGRRGMAMAPSVTDGDRPQRIGEVEGAEPGRHPTRSAEVDRVLGGGLVPGSVTLLGGEPGVGKSTLLLQLAASIAATGERVLYASGEEATRPLRDRAARLGALPDELWVVSETSLPAVRAHVDDLEPAVLIVDSIQTVHDPDLSGTPGSVTQVRECAARLVEQAKRRELTTLLVGHVTKDGAIAGPRTLCHVVDTVLAFEGDRHQALRLLRATKHRYGTTDELGVFAMTARGLEAIPDPSRLFLADHRAGVAGSVVVPTIEGQRPLLVEVQALAVEGPPGSPRRSAQGLDGGRLAMLLAILGQRVGLSCERHDVYALAVGGVRLTEPAVDLGLALAVASVRLDAPLDPDLVVCGEVGLGGEVRQVAALERRLAEAARLGFTIAVVPRGAPEVAGLEIRRVGTLGEALEAAGVVPVVRARAG